MLDNGDGTFDCLFVPEDEGRHDVEVLYGGAPVPGSPFSVKAKKPVDVDKIKCQPKLDKEPIVDEEIVYAVDTRPTESAPGEGLLNGSLLTPSGEKEPVRIKDNNDGTFDVSCVPKEPGPHELSVDYDGVPLAGSPFKFDAVEGGADKVKAYGKGKSGISHASGGDAIGVEARTEGGGEGVLKGLFYGCQKCEWLPYRPKVGLKG